MRSQRLARNSYLWLANDSPSLIFFRFLLIFSTQPAVVDIFLCIQLLPYTENINFFYICLLQLQNLDSSLRNAEHLQQKLYSIFCVISLAAGGYSLGGPISLRKLQSQISSVSSSITIRQSIFYLIIKKYIRNMRKGLINKLKQNYEVGLIQSSIGYQNNNDMSIIEQLDFDDEPDSDHHIKQRGDIFKVIESRVVENNPKPNMAFDRQSLLESERNIEKMINDKTKARFEQYQRKYERNHHSYRKSNLDLQPKMRRIGSNQPHSYLDHNKQNDQAELKIKFDFKRSAVVKHKDFILENLTPTCPFCNRPMSQVFQQSLLCSNGDCREKQIFEQIKNFPLLGLLYDIQVPSCTFKELGELSKKVEEQLVKLQRWRKSLIELEFEVRKLKSLKQRTAGKEKAQIKEFLETIDLFKKSKSSSIDNLQIQMISLNLEGHFEQFDLWQKITNKEAVLQFKQLQQNIEKLKPLCLKPIKDSLVNEQSTLTNNFSNAILTLNTSIKIPYSFVEKLEKVIMKVDGPLELNRENFLLVEEIKQLHIEFLNKKTSRELRQLFHLLPKSKALHFKFDYKLHSHVSSEGFPFFSQLFELPCEELVISIENGRPETLEDFRKAVSGMKPKQKLWIKINMNPFLIEETEEIQIGHHKFQTNTIINLIKKCGPELISLDLKLPIHADKDEILEFLLNHDYIKLVSLKMKFDQGSNNSHKSSISALFDSILLKKNYVLSLLVETQTNPHQKLRQKTLREAVFDSLI